MSLARNSCGGSARAHEERALASQRQTESVLTVAICTYNGANRITVAFDGLRKQLLGDISFEILVIDNGSNDDLKGVVAAQTGLPTLRLIREDRLGLSHARMAAVRACQTPFLAFVDDDNELTEGYLIIALGHLLNDQSIGAVGGRSIARYNGDLPDWFSHYQGSYAVGDQLPASGDATESPGYLWGAGLVLRTSILKDLYELGFRSLLSDRKGASLASGGDVEICRAIRMVGYKLYYDNHMVFYHDMFPARLTWSYLEGMYRAHGSTLVWLAVYDAAERPEPSGRILGAKGVWLRWFFAAFKNWVAQRKRWVAAGRPIEDSFERLWLLTQWQRLKTIITVRSEIDRNISEVRGANWRLKTVFGAQD